MKEFLGTSAFVTGAVSGIGLGIATALVLASRKLSVRDKVPTAPHPTEPRAVA